MTTIIGTNLNPAAQREALARFVNRFTGNHTPRWVSKPQSNGTPWPLQFKDDADWLAHTFFAINKNGSLSARQAFCESHPTWPNNPGLRTKFVNTPLVDVE